MTKPQGLVAVATWPCDAILERTYEFLDGELSVDAEALIRDHLATCARCRRAIWHDQAFLECLERCARVEPAPAELRDRIVDAIEHEDASRSKP